MIEVIGESRQFLQTLEVKGKSRNTIKNYKTDLQCFIDYLVAHKMDCTFNEFKINQVNEYSTYIDNKYNSVNSKRRRIQALRLFFDYLIEKGLQDENPIRKIPTSPKFVDIPRPLPYEDVRKVVAFINQKIENTQGLTKLIHERTKFIIMTIYGAGLKVSQIEKIKKDHFLHANGVLRVLVTPAKRDPFTITTPSFYESFYFGYKDKITQNEQLQDLDPSALTFNANPYKILSTSISARGIELIFKDISKNLGIENFTPRTLRQSCIFRWMNEGTPDITVKEWMGVLPSYSLKLYKQELKEKNFHFGPVDLDH